MSELLDWAESAGRENMRYHLQCADALLSESNTTLSILLAGAGSSLAYLINLVEAADSEVNVLVSVSAITAYLFILCTILIFKCLMISEIPSPANEPMNLYQPSYSLEKLKEAELKNLQDRIREVSKRNNKTSYWLNKVRLGAAFSPASFFITYLVVA